MDISLVLGESRKRFGSPLRLFRLHILQQPFLGGQFFPAPVRGAQLFDLRRKRGRHPLHILPMCFPESDVILIEPFQRIVGEVCEPGILLAFQARWYAQLVLINAPGNARLFQPLREGFPAHRGAEVHIGIPHVRNGGRVLFLADGARPQMQPVRRGAGEGGAEILIANGESVGEGVIEWKIFAIVKAHGEGHPCTIFSRRCFRIQPAIVIAVIAGVGLVAPGMRQRSQPGGLRVFEIQAKGRVGFAGGVGLQPHWSLVGQSHGAGIVESANSAQLSERVIE